ncbi:hypothetical protein SAOR_03765 [Salinisphaera orenii MK-B5]|uniref:DUF4426 domain-containing protein n=1 Tax=Salinisphaera orenii MK-B5 TaxID=856730 RepID=A0A423PUM4_9GAMM|nr:hypothetical protein SAOR_03765 [Salinisphaera orenii MK-B5]
MQYSAVNSMQIPASVAEANGIERAGDRAVVMVTLQRPTADAPLNAVPARVAGQARTLMGETRALSFTQVESANSVYSLAGLPIGDDDTLTLSLDVRAEDGSAMIPVEFNQTFYTE